LFLKGEKGGEVPMKSGFVGGKGEKESLSLLYGKNRHKHTQI